jgi:hypothetical protein
MTKQDQILRAHAILTALKSNVPQSFEVPDRWVSDFHTAIDKIEKATSIDLAEFRIDPSELKKSVSSSNYMSGEVNYRPGLWCKREILMQKLDSVLTYFSGLQSGSTPGIRSDPCVFVGHGRSKLWARVQVFVKDELKVPVVTYESEPHTGESIVPVLEKLLEQATFAILVLTAEDEMPEGKKRARQNVVHEAGLFQGRLGFKKAVMLVQEGIEEFSNVDGLQVIQFTKEDIEHTFYELQRALEREKQIKYSFSHTP